MKKSIAFYLATFLLLYLNKTQAQCSSGVYSLCNNATYTLTAESGLNNVRWQKQIGNTFTTVAVSNSIIVSDAGKYKYIAEDANGCTIELCCPYEFLQDSNLEPYSLCEGESYTVTAQSGLSNIQWQKYTNGSFVNIAGATTNNLMVNEIGKYRYNATDINGCSVELCCPFEFVKGAGCCTSAPTHSICAGETYTLTAQTGLNNIKWQKHNGATFADIAGATQNTYTVTDAGKYRYVAKDANACDIELCCPFDFTPCCPPQNYTACAGETYTLTAEVGMSNIQWQKEVNGLFTNISGANNAAYMVTEMGKYRYTATNAANGCVEMCCPFLVNYFDSPNATLMTTPSCAALGESKILNPMLTPITEIKIDNGLFQAAPSNFIITGLSIGIHTITLKDANGCTVTRTISTQNKVSAICTSAKIVRK